jgi:hypothetical protein
MFKNSSPDQFLKGIEMYGNKGDGIGKETGKGIRQFTRGRGDREIKLRRGGREGRGGMVVGR